MARRTGIPGTTSAATPSIPGTRRTSSTSCSLTATTTRPTVDTRVKMLGIAVMELRARISHFLTIFRVCLRQGWLGTLAKRNRRNARKLAGGEGAKGLLRIRAKKGLLFPQGPQAEKLGLVFSGELPEGYRTRKQRRAGPDTG